MIEIWYRLGMGPLFEQWKRMMLGIVADADPTLALWDFAQEHRWTIEPPPPAGDTRSAMQWYWEPSHYKAVLGEQILRRMLGDHQPDDFGCRLTPQTVEPCLAEAERLRSDYLARSGESTTTASRGQAPPRFLPIYIAFQCRAADQSP